MNYLINTKDKIFIAGSTGMVGKAIHAKLLENNYINLLTPNRSELNLLDYEAVTNWFRINKPSVVIIAAAKVGGILANHLHPVEFLLENLKNSNQHY